MKLTLQLKLLPSPDQHVALLQTMHAFNAAASHAARVGAATSDGTTHSGSDVEACRTRYAKRRQRLQRAAHVAQMDGKRPKNIWRALHRTARREAGFRRDVNHGISKTLVAAAKDTGRGIALEELTHIRDRARFRQPQHAKMTGWAFAQLRSFVEYKAQRDGVPVALVDPQHTSQQCSVCGHVARVNRQTQARFSCKQCGYTTHADFNAATNIRNRVESTGLWLRFAFPSSSGCWLAKPATSCRLELAVVDVYAVFSLPLSEESLLYCHIGSYRLQGTNEVSK